MQTKYFEKLTEGKKERERIVQPTESVPRYPNDQSPAMQSPGARNSIKMSYTGGKDPAT